MPMSMRSGLPLVLCTLLALIRGGCGVSPMRPKQPQPPHDSEARPGAEEVASIKALEHTYGKRRSKHGAEAPQVSHTVYDGASPDGKPIIYIEHGIDHHVETLLSMVHWFKGGSLPYHSDPPPFVASVLEAARANGSEVYVSVPNHHDSSIRRLLMERLREYNIHIGRHERPHLHIFTAIYPNLETFELAAKHRWRNDEKKLFAVHRIPLHTHGKSMKEFMGRVPGLMEENVTLDEFVDFKTWNNVIGLTPESPHYMIPTFYPHEFTQKRVNAHPTFCEQGNYYRRDWNQLTWVLWHLPRDCDFTIEAMGWGTLPLDMLTSSTKHHKIKPYQHKSEEEFMEFFQQCDYILPLLDKNTDPDYLHTLLPSSVSISLGYDIPVLGWSKLKDAYPMLTGRFYADAQGLLDLMVNITGCENQNHQAPWTHDPFDETPYFR